MKSKLLIICGPTAVGKTGIGIELAKKYSGEIISADSRQVYRGMDSGTGKDIEQSSKFIDRSLHLGWRSTDVHMGYREKEGIPIWLVDAVSPTYQFNVSDFKRAASLVISDILKRGKLPIIVGGTGLYIKSLLSPIDTISIPQNSRLRDESEGKSVAWLQNALQKVNYLRFETMNNSDQHNPRRLIRAIEVAAFQKNNLRTTAVIPDLIGDPENIDFRFRGNNVLLVGLTAPLDILKKRIEKRVSARLEAGLIDEVKQLRDQGYAWNLPAMSATGYRSWQSFFENSATQKQVIEQIKREEIQYAKRQITWFKKMKDVHMINPDSKKDLMDKISKWYTNV